MYIVFEGVVGTGKSTQIKKLYKYLQKKYPDKEMLMTREPGGTEISEAISLSKDHKVKFTILKPKPRTEEEPKLTMDVIKDVL